MARDTGVRPVMPYVTTEDSPAAAVPLSGVSNPGAPTARLQTTDTGRAEWLYDLPLIPLIIPTIAQTGNLWVSMFEIIKRHHLDTFDADPVLGSNLAVPAFEKTDIEASRGFLLKANMANVGEIYVHNVPFPVSGNIGTSTAYHADTIASATTGSRIVTGTNTTALASYTHWGSTAYPGMPLMPGESLFFEITRASNVYLVPDAANLKLHWMPL